MRPLRLLLCGDVMTGRGIGQVLPRPGAPALHYALVENALGVRNDEVVFVSSNGFDVVGAKHFGFKVAWIRRGGGPSIPQDPVSPAQMYRLLRGHSETLGYLQDVTVSALTDLPSQL